jgi:hypothetical protein
MDIDARGDRALWNAKRRETRKIATAPIRGAAIKEFAATV